MNPSNFLLKIIFICFYEKMLASIFLLNVMILYFFKHLPRIDALLRKNRLCFFLDLNGITESWCIGCDGKKTYENLKKSFCLICFLYCVFIQWFIWFKANEIGHVVRQKSGNFFQLMFVLEIFDCTMHSLQSN